MIHRIANKTYNGHGLYRNYDNYNPLNLPPYTIRLLYKDNVNPSFTAGSASQVSQYPNVWDLTYVNNDWNYLLDSHTDLLEVKGANTENVTILYGTFRVCSNLSSVNVFDTRNTVDTLWMFYNCKNLIDCPNFDTSNVTSMEAMFANCSSVTSIPLYNTTNVKTVSYMFSNCYNVNNGIVDFYNNVSNHSPNLMSHNSTFRNCGVSSQTGSAELAQIPDDWK